MNSPLDPAQLELEVASLSGWVVDHDSLMKKFSFNSFRDAMAFMVRIGFEAEEKNHHPEMLNVYNSVQIRLSTHDAGGKITAKDIELAKRIDAVK